MVSINDMDAQMAACSGPASGTSGPGDLTSDGFAICRPKHRTRGCARALCASFVTVAIS